MDILKAIFGIDDRKVNLEERDVKELKEKVKEGKTESIRTKKLVSKILDVFSGKNPGLSENEMRDKNDKAEFDEIIEEIKLGKYKHGSKEMAKKIQRCKEIISTTINNMGKAVKDEELDPNLRKEIEEEKKAMHDKLTETLEEAILANPNIDDEDRKAREEAYARFGNEPSIENTHIVSTPLQVFGAEISDDLSGDTNEAVQSLSEEDIIETKAEEPIEEEIVPEEIETEEPIEEEIAPEENEAEEPIEEEIVPEETENKEKVETASEEGEEEMIQTNSNETLEDLTGFSSYSDYVAAYCRMKNLKNEELISFASLLASGKTPKDLLTNDEFIKEKQRQESKKKADELELKVANEQKRIRTLESRLSATNDDLAAAIVEGSTLKAQVQTLREEKEALGEANIDSERKTRELEKQIASLNAQLANTKKSVNEATSEVLAQTKTISEQQKELIDARKEVERLTESLQASEQQSEEARRELAAANEKISQMATSLTKQLDSIKADDELERVVLERAKEKAETEENSKKNKKQKKAKHMASTPKHMREEAPIEEAEPENEKQEEPKIEFGSDEVVIEPEEPKKPTQEETEKPIVIANSTDPAYPGVFTQTPEGEVEFNYSPFVKITEEQPQRPGIVELAEAQAEKSGRSR